MEGHHAFSKKEYILWLLTMLLVLSMPSLPVLVAEGRLSNSPNSMIRKSASQSTQRSTESSIIIEEDEDENASNFIGKFSSSRSIRNNNRKSTGRSLQGGNINNNVHEFVTQAGPVVIFLIFLFLVCCCWGCLRDVLCAICLCEICEGVFG
jgi:hypothetical protein